MTENILIAIAWPYSNAEIHVGNLTGSHLPGDIVARYHRLKGNNVLVVSGTDSHGTPVVLAADKEGRPVFLAESAWALQMAQEKNPAIQFHFISEFKEEN